MNSSKTKKRDTPKVRKDRSTIILILLAAILLVLVLLFFNQQFLSKNPQTAGTLKQKITAPIIQRMGLMNEKEIEAAVQENVQPIPEEPEETELLNTVENQTSQESIETIQELEINAPLYFISVNDDGVISLQSIIKTIYYEKDPLKPLISELLKGPDAKGINKGYFSLIPENSEVLSVYQNDNTAIISFNEAFRFNSLGREGYSAQLQQIVYTVTELDGIDQVQILIDGKKLEYLGADGLYIGEPLKREQF